jgi:hypothetical protein
LFGRASGLSLGTGCFDGSRFWAGRRGTTTMPPELGMIVAHPGMCGGGLAGLLGPGCDRVQDTGREAGATRAGATFRHASFIIISVGWT